MLHAPPLSWHHPQGAWPLESQCVLLWPATCLLCLATQPTVPPFIIFFYLIHLHPTVHTRAHSHTHRGLLRHGCTNTICLLLKVCKQKDTICARCSFCVQFTLNSLRRWALFAQVCASSCACVSVCVCVFPFAHVLYMFFYSLTIGGPRMAADHFPAQSSYHFKSIVLDLVVRCSFQFQMTLPCFLSLTHSNTHTHAPH